jgi:hypothetical protein
VRATTILEGLSRQGVELWAEGDKLRYRGSKRVLTPELLGQLKENKAQIIEALADEVAEPRFDLLKIARKKLPPLKEEDRVDLDELIQANQPPDQGRDPMVKRGTDKEEFFRGNWREAWPRDFKVYRGGKA